MVPIVSKDTVPFIRLPKSNNAKLVPALNTCLDIHDIALSRAKFGDSHFVWDLRPTPPVVVERDDTIPDHIRIAAPVIEEMMDCLDSFRGRGRKDNICEKYHDPQKGHQVWGVDRWFSAEKPNSLACACLDMCWHCDDA